MSDSDGGSDVQAVRAGGFGSVFSKAPGEAVRIVGRGNWSHGHAAALSVSRADAVVTADPAAYGSLGSPPSPALLSDSVAIRVGGPGTARIDVPGGAAVAGPEADLHRSDPVNAMAWTIVPPCGMTPHAVAMAVLEVRPNFAFAERLAARGVEARKVRDMEDRRALSRGIPRSWAGGAGSLDRPAAAGVAGRDRDGRDRGGDGPSR